MILLIIVYWDDVGGFSLYPLQDPKHQSLQSDSCPWTTAGPSLSTSTQISSSFTAPTTTSSTKVIPEDTRAAAGKQEQEEEEEEKQEHEKMETREDEKKERSHTSVNDREQERRKQRIMDVCSGEDTVEFPGRTRPFEQIPNRELDHLIVDDTHQIIYCYVPKVQLSSLYVNVDGDVAVGGESAHCWSEKTTKTNLKWQLTVFPPVFWN